MTDTKGLATMENSQRLQGAPRGSNISTKSQQAAAPTFHEERVEVIATLTPIQESDGAQGIPLDAEQNRTVRLWIRSSDLRVMRALGPTARINADAPMPVSHRGGTIRSQAHGDPDSPLAVTFVINLPTAETGRVAVPGWGIRHRRPVVVSAQAARPTMRS